MTPVLLAGLLACAPPPPPPMGVTQVRWFTSRDAQTWAEGPGPLAEKLASLGLSERPDGALWVSALDHGGRAGPLDRWLGAPEVAGLVWDGQSWSRDSWTVEDPEAVAFIDPQWLGEELWYLARVGTHGDPALDTRPVAVRSAPPGVTRYAAPQIADPSPLWFRGQLLVFLTEGHSAVVQLAGEPLAVVGRFPGVSVPFALEVDGELWLLAQQLRDGRRQPVRARSPDGRSFGPFEPLLPPDAVGDCTSPVLGRSGGTWHLLCVEEPRAGG